MKRGMIRDGSYECWGTDIVREGMVSLWSFVAILYGIGGHYCDHYVERSSMATFGHKPYCEDIRRSNLVGGRGAVEN